MARNTNAAPKATPAAQAPAAQAPAAQALTLAGQVAALPAAQATPAAQAPAKPRSSVPLQGAYHFPNGPRTTVKASTFGDEHKVAIWEAIWTCNTFEAYFAKAPKEGKKASPKGGKVTPNSEMAYAIKRGWVAVGAAPAQAKAA